MERTACLFSSASDINVNCINWRHLFYLEHTDLFLHQPGKSMTDSVYFGAPLLPLPMNVLKTFCRQNLRRFMVLLVFYPQMFSCKCHTRCSLCRDTRLLEFRKRSWRWWINLRWNRARVPFFCPSWSGKANMARFPEGPAGTLSTDVSIKLLHDTPICSGDDLSMWQEMWWRRKEWRLGN